MKISLEEVVEIFLNSFLEHHDIFFLLQNSFFVYVYHYTTHPLGIEFRLNMAKIM